MTSAAPTSVVDLATSGIYATGGQLYVEVRGTVWCDVALGHSIGEPIETSTLFPAYCATKPLLPIAVAHLVDEGYVDLDDPAGHATIADVLAHRASMGEPRAALWRMTPRDRRAALFLPSNGLSPEYSEIAGWLALASVVETATGIAAATYVEKAVLEPLGLIDDVIVDAGRVRQALDAGRMHVPIAGLPHEAVPLLSERLPQQLDDVTTAFGGLVSASGLGRFYTCLRRALVGEPVAGMPSAAALRSLLACERPTAFDPVLQRPCRFAGGLMVDLDDHGVTSRLADGLGHTSGIVPTFGLCDPARGLTIASVLNGVSMSSQDLEHARRSIVDAVLHEVDG